MVVVLAVTAFVLTTTTPTPTLADTASETFYPSIDGWIEYKNGVLNAIETGTYALIAGEENKESIE